MSSAEPVSVADRAGGASTRGSGRVGNLDVLRAVAAFGVLIGHAYALGGRSVPLQAEHSYDVALLGGAAGVWLFFGLSGYVIAKPFLDRLVTGEPLPQLVPYAVRRALRIFPLYWICLIAVLIVAGAGTAAAWHYPLHFGLMHNLVPGREQAIFSVAWTLTIEVLFYIAVPLLALGIRRWRPLISADGIAKLVAGSWIASICFTVLADLYPYGKTGVWLRGTFVANWQMFCPGILLALTPHLSGAWRERLTEIPRRPLALAAAGALLAAGCILQATAPLRYGVAEYQLMVDASRPILAVGFGILIAASIQARPVTARWALHLGLISYGIYLIHAVLLEFFLSGYGDQLIPLARDGFVPFLVHVVILAGVTIPLAMASWRFLERPLIGQSRRFGQIRRPRASARTTATSG